MTEKSTEPPRPLSAAIVRGLACRCPRCGRGRLFDGYLRVATRCDDCGLRLDGHRADDLPPYLTVLIAGKLAIAALIVLESAATLTSFQLHVAVIGIALTAALGFLRPMKGLVIGLQWANEMHGFSPDGDPADSPAEP